MDGDLTTSRTGARGDMINIEWGREEYGRVNILRSRETSQQTRKTNRQPQACLMLSQFPCRIIVSSAVAVAATAPVAHPPPHRLRSSSSSSCSPVALHERSPPSSPYRSTKLRHLPNGDDDVHVVAGPLAPKSSALAPYLHRQPQIRASHLPRRTDWSCVAVAIENAAHC